MFKTMSNTIKITVVSAAVGALVGAGVAWAVVANGVKDARETSSNGNVSIGFGLDGQTDKDSTAVVRRTGIRNGQGQGDEAALFVESTINCGGGDCVALETNGGGIGILVEKTRANKKGIVVDMGNLNTNGSKLDRVALEARGNIKLCGKSKTNDPACANRTLLFVRKGGGTNQPTELVVRFANGDEAVLASGN